MVRRASWIECLLLSCVTGLANTGCSENGDERCRVAENAAPIVGGSADVTYLRLGQAERSALGAIVSEESASLCTGVLVGPKWVLTATHCESFARRFVVGPSLSEPEGDFPIVSATPHPNELVSLLELDVASAPRELSFVRVSERAFDASARGELVQLAGYGLTEDGRVGELEFAVEPIDTVDGLAFSVDGRGASGACSGDSGGPALVRGDDGAVEVAGVLQFGSVSCRDVDVFARVDGIGPWLAEHFEASSAGPGECGALDAEGACYEGVAVWCDGGGLHGERCDGLRCGWDALAHGYRCVPEDSGACPDVDSFGSCIDGAAVTCSAGTRVVNDCSGCTSACARSPVTGRVACDSP